MGWTLCKQTIDAILDVYQTAATKTETDQRIQKVKRKFMKDYSVYIASLTYTHEIYKERLYMEKIWEECIRMAENDLLTVRDYFMRVHK